MKHGAYSDFLFTTEMPYHFMNILKTGTHRPFGCIDTESSSTKSILLQYILWYFINIKMKHKYLSLLIFCTYIKMPEDILYLISISLYKYSVKYSISSSNTKYHLNIDSINVSFKRATISYHRLPLLFSFVDFITKYLI